MAAITFCIAFNGGWEGMCKRRGNLCVEGTNLICCCCVYIHIYTNNILFDPNCLKTLSHFGCAGSGSLQSRFRQEFNLCQSDCDGFKPCRDTALSLWPRKTTDISISSECADKHTRIGHTGLQPEETQWHSYYSHRANKYCQINTLWNCTTVQREVEHNQAHMTQK